MSIRVKYADVVRSKFPDLVTRTIHIQSIHFDINTPSAIAHFAAIAASRLSAASESEFPEVQAWRRAFAKMGLRPTQHRCASEALLRRFRKEGDLPRLHPLIDLCNFASLSSGIPIAVFDTTRISGGLEVRPAFGNEVYETFAGAVEHPEPGEIIFADENDRAHARRWTNRQSGYSAVRAETVTALIVAEALHANAAQDLASLMTELTTAISATWPACEMVAA